MSSISSSELLKVIGELNSIAKATGIDLNYRVGGTIRVDDLGIDLGFNNRDCNGVCSTNCSGCSACSGCSGCSNTATVKAFEPDLTVSNPNPVSQFVAILKDPSVQALLEEAAKNAARR